MSSTREAVQAATEGGNSSSGSTFQFPLDGYENESGHWLILNEYNYFRVSSTNRGQGQTSGKAFKLPVPQTLGTQYDAEWEALDVGFFGNKVLESIPNVAASAKGIIGRMFNGQSTDATRSTDLSNTPARSKTGTYGHDMLSAGIDALSTAGQWLGAGALDGLAGSEAATKLGLYGGVARNPFMSVAYKGPSLRSFNFSWEFLPRSEAESNALQAMVNNLKFGMHPSYYDLGSPAFQNALFEYPNLYKPEFTHPEYLFNFGFCVIKSIDFNPHPKGSVYHSNAAGNKIPAMVELRISLQEIEIITKENLGGSNLGGGQQGPSIPGPT